ncbi:MAG: gliding motility-associated C-terminal domain-containing protein, partial [Saprospiraceae bacterium]|nr:gliding motility-associated C-terminal domain-containing protein [Saprospiraceae bacterium]
YSRWLPARKIWNQYAYHVVNINDDLTVPATQQAGTAELPGPGNGYRPFNTFLSQAPAFRQPDATPYFPSADLSITVKEVICQLPTFQVRLEICNNGEEKSADTTKVRFYRAGNPFSAPASNSIGTFTVSTQAIPPDSCISFTAILPLASGNVYAVLNDWGTFNTPLPGGDTVFYRQECDLANNVAVFTMNLSNGLPLSIGPDQILCGGQTLTLNASPGFSSYLWQNGATSASIQVGLPGLYWVEARDLCFNIRRDSLVITDGDDWEVIQATVCEGEFFQYAGQDIPADSSLSFVYTNINGCDSTIVVQVSGLPVVSGMDTLTICSGDSILVFGNYVQNTGVFSQNFTAANGCDSLHTITVTVLPAPTPSGESRSICPGDSTLVFGNYVQNAGVFSQNFTAANGCDSLHTIVVTEVPYYYFEDTLSLCPGDSIQVHGGWVFEPGVIQTTLQGQAGCDSLWNVTVVEPVVPDVILTVTQPDALLNTGSIAITGGGDSRYGLDGIHFTEATGFEGLTAGNYTLFQLFDGCVVRHEFNILPFETTTVNKVYAPNVFSPGTGSENAGFTLYARAGMVRRIEWLRIYDRWGSLVFENSVFLPGDAATGWNGNIGRNAAATGVYFWQAMIEYADGVKMLEKGDLTLIR